MESYGFSMRRAARVDVVQADIIEGLRSNGIACLPMPDPGDVLTYGFHIRIKEYIYVPMEIKSPKRVRNKKDEMTPAQKRRALVMPIPLVHSISEALSLYGQTLS